MKFDDEHALIMMPELEGALSKFCNKNMEEYTKLLNEINIKINNENFKHIHHINKDFIL